MGCRTQGDLEGLRDREAEYTAVVGVDVPAAEAALGGVVPVLLLSRRRGERGHRASGENRSGDLVAQPVQQESQQCDGESELAEDGEKGFPSGVLQRR